MTNLKDLKPYFLLILFFFFCLFIFSKIAWPIPLSMVSTVTNKMEAYTVTGEGKAVAKPDIAYVSIGVEGSGVTVKQAQNQINEVMTKVIAGLKKTGINTDQDIKTSNYSINPDYDWNSGRQKIAGYRADAELSVKVKDIEKINQVVDSSTENGANQINRITFDVDDKEKLEANARKEAVANAKKKAEAAARIAGFKLGKLINYYESSNDYDRPISMKNMPVGMGEGEMAETNIQTGTQEIKINVTLSYQLE